jgi:hypothetical protein
MQNHHFSKVCPRSDITLSGFSRNQKEKDRLLTTPKVLFAQSRLVVAKGRYLLLGPASFIKE